MCLFSFYPQSEKVADPLRLFSLLSLGEIGRHMYVENCSLCSLQYKRFGPPHRPLCLNLALRPLSRHSRLFHHRWLLAEKEKVTETPGVLKIPSSVWNTHSKAEGAQITWEKNSEVGAGEMSLKAVARSVSKRGGGSWDLSPSPLFLSTTLYSLIKFIGLNLGLSFLSFQWLKQSSRTSCGHLRLLLVTIRGSKVSGFFRIRFDLLRVC